MKILHVTKKYPNALGGDAIVVSNLEKQQKKLGHKVFILTTNCDEIKNSSNVTKFGLKDTPQNLDRITLKRIISLLILFFKSFKLIKEINPDIIHSHSIDMGFILSFACKLYKIPLVNTRHGVTFPDKQYSFIKRYTEKFLLKDTGFKKIMTVDINSLSDFKKAKIKNVIYMPNGVDLEKFNRKKEGKINKTIFLFVGRLEEQKGLNYLTDAVKILSKKNKNFGILIIGEGSEKVNLQKQISKLKIGKCIKFLGKKNYKKTLKYYFSSDIFILPSIWEGFPLTVLEAWAAKLPAIITNVGGISKVCTNKENALITPPKNPKKIAEAMLTLMKDKKLRQKLGENGRRLVEEKYTWEKIAKKVEKIYEEVKR